MHVRSQIEILLDEADLELAEITLAVSGGVGVAEKREGEID